MVCPFGGLLPDLMGKANVVKVSFEDRPIFSRSVTPTLRAEAKMVRNDLLLPKRQTVKGFMLKNFLTLEDGRKIIACTFRRENYLGMADIPMGSVLELTFKKATKSGKIYIREVKVKNDCPTP